LSCRECGGGVWQCVARRAESCGPDVFVVARVRHRHPFLGQVWR
jgi:hypothetical protein